MGLAAAVLPGPAQPAARLADAGTRGWRLPAGRTRRGLPDPLRTALPAALHRPVTVTAVTPDSAGAGSKFRVATSAGDWAARAVISATGTWTRPFLAALPGAASFTGTHLHTVGYRSPDPFAGQRVVVVGGGNSAAQILAEVSTVAASTTWVTQRPPRFLPDDVDGRVLFDVATARSQAVAQGRADDGGVAGLGDIVMLPPVREARGRGVLAARSMFTHLAPAGPVWDDGTAEPADAVIWCTGFRPALTHLAPLHLRAQDGPIPTEGTASTRIPGLHLLGYGDWTGSASATLIGVGRAARDSAARIARSLTQPATAAP